MKARVLVVDDEAKVLRITKLALEKAGYLVTTANDGVEALETLRAEPFDVLVTDVNMPRMTGEELCLAIQEEETLPRRPLIFVATGRTGERHRAWAIELENVVLLEKPVSLRALVARIGERLSEAGSAGGEA